MADYFGVIHSNLTWWTNGIGHRDSAVPVQWPARATRGLTPDKGLDYSDDEEFVAQSARPTHLPHRPTAPMPPRFK